MVKLLPYQTTEKVTGTTYLSIDFKLPKLCNFSGPEKIAIPLPSIRLFWSVWLPVVKQLCTRCISGISRGVRGANSEQKLKFPEAEAHQTSPNNYVTVVAQHDNNVNSALNSDEP